MEMCKSTDSVKDGDASELKPQLQGSRLIPHNQKRLQLGRERDEMSKHTQGPWTIDHQQIGPWGEPVALLCDMAASSSGTVVEWPRMPAETIDDTENEANARLIASAPDLLAALEALQLDLENNGEVYRTDTARLAVIEQAIAKATGQEVE